MKRRDLLRAAPLSLPLSMAFFSRDSSTVPDLGGGRPDLVNLHDTVQWLERQNSPKASFLDARWQSIEEWKAAVRPEFIRLLQYAPPSRPLAASSR